MFNTKYHDIICKYYIVMTRYFNNEFNSKVTLNITYDYGEILWYSLKSVKSANVDNCVVNVPHNGYNNSRRILSMDKENKTYSMSIRVSEEELEKLKQAARLESYSSYSEFIRRTALIEASKIIEDANLRKNKK